eukprot:comp12727_c0_seq1/m.7836 comp12727_c0_seq1/g.7836  ORF comp12727_c0_seq1/g.7836 comp12727_c0_seq1/m.7836 type:complete len:435 (-) comp12727_c0_seq1:431-1735(-)
MAPKGKGAAAQKAPAKGAEAVRPPKKAAASSAPSAFNFQTIMTLVTIGLSLWLTKTEFFNEFVTEHILPLITSPPTNLSTGASLCEGASRYFGEQPFVGFHIACVKQGPSGVSVDVWMDGLEDAQKNFTVSANTIKKLRAGFDDNIIRRKPTTELAKKWQQPWAIFSPNGKRLEKFDEVISQGIVFIYEGGQFLYPPVKIGFEQYVSVDFGNITLTTLSVSPVVLNVSKLLLEDEMDWVIKKAFPTLKSSGVVALEGQADRPASDWRTSSNTWLQADEKVSVIDERVAELTHVPKHHQELVQVLRYKETQKYVAHHDYFDLEMIDAATRERDHWPRKMAHGFGNRLATVFWYMSNVEEGGETWFASTREEAEDHYPPLQCKEGMMVKPVKGTAIIFYSLLPSGEVDVMSKHAGCPVIKGTKFAANKWIWNKQFE